MIPSTYRKLFVIWKRWGVGIFSQYYRFSAHLLRLSYRRERFVSVYLTYFHAFQLSSLTPGHLHLRDDQFPFHSSRKKFNALPRWYWYRHGHHCCRWIIFSCKHIHMIRSQCTEQTWRAERISLFTVFPPPCSYLSSLTLPPTLLLMIVQLTRAVAKLKLLPWQRLANTLLTKKRGGWITWPFRLPLAVVTKQNVGFETFQRHLVLQNWAHTL